MNKKFSTLVAALLLSASVGTFTASAANSLIDANNITKAYDASAATKGKGYEQGKSYLLEVETGKYLSVAQTANGLWEVVITDADGATALPELYKLMWTVSIVENAGAEPLYTFVNKYTQTVLAIDVDAAKSNAAKYAADNTTTDFNFEMAGAITSLQSAASYKEPAAAPVYANIGGDKFAYLQKVDVNGVTKVYATIAKKSELSTAATMTITPYKVGDIVLSANDLNTLLYAGLPATEAKAGDYFDLSFNPALESVFTDSKLQAVAVKHSELPYGEIEDPVGGDYASLVEIENAYKSGARDYVALKNLKGDYLVVDTAYVPGTDNNNNGLLQFTTDGLYNAKNETRLREPGSYLFKFILNVTDQNVDIAVKDYLRKTKLPYKATGAPEPTNVTTDISEFYGKDVTAGNEYAKKFVKEGSQWYNNDAFAVATVANGGKVSATDEDNLDPAVDEVFVTHVLLNTTDLVTLGTQRPEEVGTKSNIIDIKVGTQAIFIPTTMPAGAYLLQVVESPIASEKGKYLVDNLVGGWELAEQAVRQNFQHMPAAQWVVESNGNATTITNREFENVYRNGILYAGGAGNQGFFFGDRTYKFIPVEDAANKYLGYKFVEDGELNETRFTFNYLHDLAMDKPINTINSKDSVVWVDKNGEAMTFSLVKVVDDEYGYNGGLKNVAKLNRRVYAIKVNDPSKIVNNHRYLRYDAAQKKYVVAKNSYDYFLLKENNEVEGGECYYTLLNANVPFVGKRTAEDFVVTAGPDGKQYFANATFTDIDQYVNDGDVTGFYYLNPAKVVNAAGVLVDGYAPAVYKVAEEYYSAENYEPVASANEIAALGYQTTENDKPNYVTVDNGIYKQVIDGKTYVLVYDKLNSAPRNYATDKVSVDNNTLALVNGVLADNYAQEVANSAFAVKHAESQLYRHIATTDTVKVFRVNSTEKEYLYEDATSKYSADKDFNFLGVEDKGLTKKPAMFLDTAYVNRGTIMPQYMFVLRPTIQEADTIWCNATTTHKHNTLADSLACPHTTILPKCVKGYYLVDLTDSVAVENDRIANSEGGILTNKYLLDNTRYVRLGFVEATHIGDSLIIANSVYTGNNNQINPAYATTWASKDTINLANNEHNRGAFSLRLINDTDDFLIESQGDKKAPANGGWIKIQNGVPVIANMAYAEAASEAEVFNLETTLESPTANETIAADEVSVVAVNGAVIIKGAAGKAVTISNILGKSLANEVISSDQATIAVPSGIVVVAVEGADAVKVVVK